LYRYVGPAEIAQHARKVPAGARVTSAVGLAEAARALGFRTELTVTYVVDAHGVLRIADRSSEHVACAGGLPVFTAGEMVIARHGREARVESATNLSTGYCPESGSWDALAEALDAIGVPPPAAFEPAFEMRRCRCGARNVVKDGLLECAECGAALPERWSFDRLRRTRGWIAHAGARWRIDRLEEAGERDEDRCGVARDADRVRLALCDGAGGMAHGAVAAERVVSAWMTSRERPAAVIREVDAQLAREASGEATAVLLDVAMEADRLRVHGASVGDSEAWAVVDRAWRELTHEQSRKPLVGSGRCTPRAFDALDAHALLVASDGLARYVDIGSLAPEDLARGDALVDRARLPTGRLRDDTSVIVVVRA
jgi:hypothetical protein